MESSQTLFCTYSWLVLVDGEDGLARLTGPTRPALGHDGLALVDANVGRTTRTFVAFGLSVSVHISLPTQGSLQSPYGLH